MLNINTMYHFTTDTVWHFTSEFLKHELKKEFSQTLCNDNGTLIPGGKISIGMGTTVKIPPMVCEKGKPIGNIHSHNEPYFDKHPFEKGYSETDIFLITQKILNKEIEHPFIGCVISPTVDKEGYFNGMDITCEKIDYFDEEDIKTMHTGIITNGQRKLFTDEEIDFIKKESPPKTGFFKTFGFKMHMANLKSQLMQQKIIEQQSFNVSMKIDDKKSTLGFEEKDTILF
jgi:hypothetical protein